MIIVQTIWANMWCLWYYPPGQGLKRIDYCRLWAVNFTENGRYPYAQNGPCHMDKMATFKQTKWPPSHTQNGRQPLFPLHPLVTCQRGGQGKKRPPPRSGYILGLKSPRAARPSMREGGARKPSAPGREAAIVWAGSPRAGASPPARCSLAR